MAVLYAVNHPGEITITSPLSGASTDSPEVTVAGRISNPRVASVRLEVNGLFEIVPVENGLFTAQARLAAGENSIRVSAGGLAAQLVSSEDDTQVHSIADVGVIKIASPADQASTDAAIITVSGTVENESVPSLTLTVNGSSQVVPVSHGDFVSDVSLGPGENTIVASVGRATDEVVSYFILNPGKIEITSPSQGMSIDSMTATITGTVENRDVPTATLTLNGTSQVVPIEDGLFEARLPVSPGENTIHAAVGRAATEPIRFLAPVAIEDFSNGSEEWTVVGNGRRPVQPTYDPTGGGFLSAEDNWGPSSVSPIDVVIVFDVTSSMENSIDSVRNSATAVIETLQTTSRDMRLGLVSFRDFPEIEAIELTSAVGDQLDRMASWEAAGGGDIPEDLLLAILEAAEMAWRTTNADGLRVSKAIVVVTDAEAKDPDGERNTVDTVAERVASLEGVRVYPILVGDNEEARQQLQRLAGTKGQMFPAADADRVADVLLESIERAVETGDPWMWQAPSRFLEALRVGYGYTLEFSLRQSCRDRQFEADDVVLTAGDRSLVYTLPERPGTDWTSYSVPLEASEGWVDPTVDQRASPEELTSVLSSLTGLRLRGEYCLGQDRGSLDDVIVRSSNLRP